MRTKALLPLLALSSILVVSAAVAQPSKLDPRARIAIASLRGGMTTEEAKSAGMAVNDAGQLDVFIRGSITRSELEAMGVTVRTALPDLFTAYLPVDLADVLAADPRIQSIRGSATCEPNLDASVPTTGATLLRGAGPTFTGLNGANILVGDIDSGLDFDHGDFRTAGNLTRCITIWDQTVSPAVNPPAGFTTGREWTQAEINGGLCTETDPVANGGHGTHCMGIIAGDGSQTGGPTPAFTYVGMAPMADIIEVKTTFQTTDILDGATYFFGKATSLGKLAVLNLSLGLQFGPHDGTSDFESGLTALTGPGKILTISAGNDRGTNWHARLFATAPESAKMSIPTIGSNAPAGNPDVAIDGYYPASDNMNVTLRAPNGTLIGPITFGNINAAYPGTTIAGVGRVYIENAAALTATGDREIYFEISRTAATSTPTGTWTFLFTPVSVPGTGRVDMWRYYNRLSINTPFTLKNTNDNLVSEPGNATGAITTAAYVTKQSWTDCGGRSVSYTASQPFGTIASFSSPGPSRNGAQKPDIAAPGFGVGSARSFDYTITCGTAASALLADLNHIINQGTSMAAPHVAGAAALLLQKYGAMTPADVKNYLNAHATIDVQTGAPWNLDFGNGKLFLGDLLDPTVLVVALNGGEVAVVGSNVNLQWNASDNIGVTNVDLLISRDGGANYAPLATAIPNTGSYNWLVDAPTSDHCLFKVVAHDANGNAGTDVSDTEWAIIDGATPTLMTMLAAQPVDDGIEVRWQFADGSGFGNASVQRAESMQGPFSDISGERHDQGAMAVMLDRGVQAGHTYWYRVQASTGAGLSRTFGPVSGTAGAGVTEFALGRVVPTPSTGIARVDYSLPKASHVQLRVVDIQGRTMVTLVNGTLPAGRYQATWNGSTERGAAPAGLYFVQMDANGKRFSSRLVLAR
jgi:subtilisin family serine protease